MKIDKAYYTLAEVRAHWPLPDPDIVYLAENGKLSLSVRVFGIPLEIGSIEETPEGEWFPVPHTQARFNGVLDLHPAHAFHVFRDGSAAVTNFLAADGDYASILPDCEAVEVRLGDLLVRKEERKRVEEEFGLAANVEGSMMFAVSEDYRKVWLGDELLQFGPIQAEVIRVLHRAHLAGDPWQNGKAVLSTAGSKSLRIADVFKSNPDWRRLIESNQRGFYRLTAALRAK